jgi:glycosyltransferase involved in cell wall biosynthesis
MAGTRPIRVLHSFPHRIGAARICTTAWHEAAGASAAGAEVTVMAGSVHRPLPPAVRVRSTLAAGPVRLPYRALGRLRALALHDRLVARALPRLAGEIDLVHTWPLGARETLGAARALGIPTVLERPNAHTRFAYEAVRAECERIGVALPPGHEHAYDAEILRVEEEEYALADALLCPSEFVVRTFLDQGTAPERLVRHLYGYDDTLFRPAPGPRRETPGITALFVGVCAVRKGVHFALDAWLQSSACRTGRLQIAGEFLPGYEALLARQLAHPSVEVLGHREDVPELMRKADVLVLPSIEEGFGLVCVEALGSGCVPLVSDACTDVCVDGENAFVHRVADVDALAAQLSALDQDRALLARMRAAALRSAPAYTWTRTGAHLVGVYEDVAARCSASRTRRAA